MLGDTSWLCPLIALCLLLIALSGCKRDATGQAGPDSASTQPASTPARGEVTLYTSADEPFARMIIEDFTRRTNIRVRPLFDTEADKTTGLARRIRAEAARPQADVFWASEPFQMIFLAHDGLLDAYLPETASDIPVAYRDAKDRWIGFGLRGRVLCYNPQMIQADALPKTWQALADSPHAEKVIFANPLFGTTRGHVAAMLSMWGEPVFTAWVDKLASAGIAKRMAAGNAMLARQVAMGQHPMGATDTDDVIVLQKAGQKIEMIYPDMGAGGTLLLPNTVGLLKNAPHADLARQLLAYLCSPIVEEALARSESANIPVRPALRDKLNIQMPPASAVDYVKVAESMPRAIEIVQERWK